MQSVIKFLFVLIFVQFFNAQSSCAMAVTEDLGKELYKNVKKVNNGFYRAKVSGKDLWLAMERIDAHNYQYWLDYISVQSNLRAMQFVDKARVGTTGDGSQHFKRVLSETPFGTNEVWVAYITRSEPFPIKGENVSGYMAESLDERTGPDFPKKIEMFVTITSNPSALITSHMGIAASIEGVRYGRTKGTSLDLHSFAAKVMLMRNPQRKYMVNTPVFAMEKIIIDALPHSIFVGTREMKEEFEKSLRLTLEDFDKENREKISSDIRKEADQQLRSLNLDLNEYLDSNVKNGKTEEEVRKKFFERDWVQNIKKNDNYNFKYVHIDDNGNFLISQQKIDSELEKKIKTAFESHKNVMKIMAQGDVGNFLSLMEKHPPIISTQRENGYEKISIFNPDKPSEVWLSIGNDNKKKYDWMFRGPFRPAGSTHYIAVNLKDLADAKQLGPM